MAKVTGLQFGERYRELISDQTEYIEQLKKEKEAAEKNYLDTLEKLKDTDMQLQNHKHWLKVAGEELNEIKKELKPLRELVSLLVVR